MRSLDIGGRDVHDRQGFRSCGGARGRDARRRSLRFQSSEPFFRFLYDGNPYDFHFVHVDKLVEDDVWYLHASDLDSLQRVLHGLPHRACEGRHGPGRGSSGRVVVLQGRVHQRRVGHNLRGRWLRGSLNSTITSGGDVVKTTSVGVRCLCAEYMAPVGAGQRHTSVDPGLLEPIRLPCREARLILSFLDALVV